jgi:hypothetical protein
MRKPFFIEAFDAKRRAFLRTLTATTAALATARCGGGSSDSKTASPVAGVPPTPTPTPTPTPSPTPTPTPTPTPNAPPVWATIPTVTFTQGVASSFSIATFVSDANGDPLTITMNAVALPAGVTFDAAGKRLVYDGIGAIRSVSGVRMTANDGQP